MDINALSLKDARNALKNTWRKEELYQSSLIEANVSRLDNKPPCEEQDKETGYFCTRPEGHTGVHIAIGFAYFQEIFAIW